MIDDARLQEMRHLIRTNVPLPVVSERQPSCEDLYDDHFTLRELVQSQLMDYIGHKDKVFYLRPRKSFRIFVVDDVMELKSGEIIQLALTDAGKLDFVRGLEDGSIG